MSPYLLASLILTLAALIAYINHQTVKVQMSIAIMAGSLFLSFVLIVLQNAGVTNITQHTKTLLIQTNFHHLLVNGMLSFLLFAGSLSIDFNALKKKKWEIGTLASFSTVASTFLIGFMLYALLPLFNLSLPLLHCLLFGALISPTDPIAVLAIFKEIKAPKNLETCVAGESLFNDGVGIVIFVILYQLTFEGVPITFSEVLKLFLQQAGGGICYGLLLGFIAKQLIMTCKDHRIAILITLALVTGGYNLALLLNISGPLAMVVAGIFVANIKSSNTYHHNTLRLFWEIIDDVLNAVLFLLLGFELLAIHATWAQSIFSILAVFIVLLVRLVTVSIPISFLQHKRQKEPYTITILTWGGLRGGLAVALALSLPPSTYRDLVLTLTFSVVAFAIIIQGLSIKPIARLAKEKSL